MNISGLSLLNFPYNKTCIFQEENAPYIHLETETEKLGPYWPTIKNIPTLVLQIFFFFLFQKYLNHGVFPLRPFPSRPFPLCPQLFPFRVFAISPLSHFAPYQFAPFPLRPFPVPPVSQIASFPSGPFLIHPFPFRPFPVLPLPHLPLSRFVPFLFCPFLFRPVPILPFSCFAHFQFCPFSIMLHKNYLFTIWPLQFFRVRREVFFFIFQWIMARIPIQVE